MTYRIAVTKRARRDLNECFARFSEYSESFAGEQTARLDYVFRTYFLIRPTLGISSSSQAHLIGLTCSVSVGEQATGSSIGLMKTPVASTCCVFGIPAVIPGLSKSRACFIAHKAQHALVGSHP